MIRTTRIGALLAGASLATLALVASANAQTTISASEPGDVVISVDTDFLNVDPGVDIGDDVIINGGVTVGPGDARPGATGNAAGNTAVYFEGADNDVGGGFINNGTISATDPGATAIYLLDTFIADGFTNNGSIQATDSQTGPGLVSASVDRGIYWSNQNDQAGGADLTLFNASSGTIDVNARALAGGVAAATANAVIASEGIILSAQQTTNVGVQALARLDNDGTIDVAASATAFSVGVATANATVETGVEINAYGGNDTVSSLVNSGDITIAANAVAAGGVTGTSSFLYAATAFANARINYGIYQSASAQLSAGQDVSALLDNTGAIVIAADAEAYGVISASADAFFSETAIAQYAYAGDDAVAELVNSSDLSVTADAFASATAGNASANAFFNSDVIAQSASADRDNDGDGDTARATIDNSGDLLIEARAEADGGPLAQAFASFNSSATAVVYQIARDAAQATVELINDSSFQIVADAEAEAAGRASAIASFSAQVLFQSASADSSEGSSAVASIDNSGTFRIVADAAATGDSTATARAVFSSTVVSQLANFAEDAVARISNDGGTFQILANAKAVSTSGAASAAATFSFTAVYQSASATGGDDSSALVAIDNSGDFVIRAAATATGLAGATASAQINDTVDDKVVYQTASAAEDATARIANSSEFGIELAAKAVSGSGDAAARATASQTLIYQTVTGNGSTESSALALIRNSGVFDLEATAAATANGSTGGNAVASALMTTYAVLQSVSSAESAIARISNDGGSLNILTQGTAKSEAGAATAAATFSSTVVAQYVTATAGGDSYGLAEIRNSSGFSIKALATATGATAANADAYIGSPAISQIVDPAETAIARIVNSGGFTIQASAKANSTSSAAAFATANLGETVILQSASGNGTSGSEATALIDNSGGFSIAATALASGFSADAIASISYAAIEQNAEGAENARAIIANSSRFTIVAKATANATSGTATASARFSDDNVIYQDVAGLDADSTARALLENTGNFGISANAKAISTSSGANAFAKFTSDVIEQAVEDAEDVRAEIVNSSTFQIVADAQAAGFDALASATFSSNAISQAVTGESGEESVALVSIDNDGTFGIKAIATATGVTTATAYAYFDTTAIEQEAEGFTATALLDNSGTFAPSDPGDPLIGGLQLVASAYAEATNGAAVASALFRTDVVDQDATGDDAAGSVATARLVNSGDLLIRAVATASATVASAFAQIGDSSTAGGSPTDIAGATSAAIDQGSSDATRTGSVLSNSGDLDIAAVANAIGTDAEARALIVAGINQSAQADEAGQVGSALVDNDGDLTIMAKAFSGFTSLNTIGATVATASGTVAHGIIQEATSGDASATFDNSGLFLVSVEGAAIADGPGSVGAAANAKAFQIISQVASGSFADEASALARVNNSGEIRVEGLAFASGLAADAFFSPTTATAGDLLPTFRQVARGAAISTAEFLNSGSLRAEGSATAIGQTATASATIVGLYQSATGDDAADVLTTRFNNSGSFTIGVNAYASGLAAFPDADVTVALQQSLTGPSTAANAEFINSGLFSAFAVASASSGTGLAGANALGYRVDGAGLTGGAGALDFRNTGTFFVSAVALAGIATASATGVLVNGGIAGTILNDGGLMGAAFATGTTGSDERAYQRGTVIDTESASSPILIALQGGSGFKEADARAIAFGGGGAPSGSSSWGVVFGNVEISGDDDIDVTDGTTFFNGIVNPDTGFEGDLSIFDDGRLILANRDQGAAQVVVNQFTVGGMSDGTIAYELGPDDTVGTPGAPGGYPQVFAEDAQLGDGSGIEVRAAAGFYTEGVAVDYDDVIDVNSRTGEFEREIINPLFDLEVIYNDEGLADPDVDLRVTFNGFDDVDGGSNNQDEIGGAIDEFLEGFDPMDPDNSDAEEGFADIVEQLPALDPDEFFDALQQLAGTAYASYLQSVLNSTNQFNETIRDRIASRGLLNGEVTGSAADLAEAPVDAILPGVVEKGSAWGRAFGTFGEQEGDEEAPGYDVRQQGILLGGDIGLGANGFVGITGGYFHADLDFDEAGRGSSDVEYDGFQVGGYAGWDNGLWYVRAIGGYARYDADVTRNIAIGVVAGQTEGDADADVFSGYGEAGYRWRIGGSRTALTPFVGLSGARAELEGFDESGFPGANLSIEDGEAEKLATRLGARISGAFDMGGFTLVPEAEVSWEHNFKDDRASFQASFLDVPGTDIDIASSATEDDSILVGVGATAAFSDHVEAKLAYDGRFNEDFDQHTVLGRVTYKFLGQ